MHHFHLRLYLWASARRLDKLFFKLGSPVKLRQQVGPDLSLLRHHYVVINLYRFILISRFFCLEKALSLRELIFLASMIAVENISERGLLLLIDSACASKHYCLGASLHERNLACYQLLERNYFGDSTVLML